MAVDAVKAAGQDALALHLVVVEGQQVIDDFVSRAGISGGVKIHKVLRVLDPSLAASSVS